MDLASLQLLAGSLSSLIFAAGALPMLVKARRTRDLRSYSGTNLALSNVGNAAHWIYVAGLPAGPIWFLHTFWTVASLLMLLWYLRFVVLDQRRRPSGGTAL